MIILTKNDIDLLIEHINVYKYIDKFIMSNLIKASIMYEFTFFYKLHYYDLERVFIKIMNKEYNNTEYSGINRLHVYMKKFMNMKKRKLYSTEQKAITVHLNFLLDNYYRFEQNVTILENFMVIYIFEHHTNYLDLILLKREKLTNKEVEYCNSIKNIFYSKYKYVYNNKKFILGEPTKKYYPDSYFPLIWRL
jgi:hypothetical protein